MATATSIDDARSGHGRPILVTGAAGFIGANFVLEWLGRALPPVVSLDKLTYAGNLDNLARRGRRPAPHLRAWRHRRRRARRRPACGSTGRRRWSTSPPSRTSIARSTARPISSAPTSWARSACWKQRAPIATALGAADQAAFRFLHVSTDEVYRLARADEPAFTETSRYQPNSPYSASKAASDHLVRAFQPHLRRCRC